MDFKRNILNFLTIVLSSVLFLTGCLSLKAQDTLVFQQKSDFWRKVKYGGELSVGFGDTALTINIIPGVMYQFSDRFSLGVGAQVGYVNREVFSNSTLYGFSGAVLYNPIKALQLSTEIERLYFSTKNSNPDVFGEGTTKENFSNTTLFTGAGYQIKNIIIGVRYNLLAKNKNNIYPDMPMPFVRAYF